MHKLDIPTPALLLDLKRMEHNLNKMAEFFSAGPTRLRPHFKNHKCVPLAKRQMAAGAIGMTCATLDEAEAVISSGIQSVLIANEIAASDKLERFVDMSQRAEVIVCIDNADVASRLGAVAAKRGVTVDVVLDIDVGLHRCGVQPGSAALELAKAAAKAGLRLRGVMGYEGQVLRKPQGEEKKAAACGAMHALVGTKELLEREGFPVEIASAGGTGSYEISGRYPGVTEIQAGSYLAMDTDYATVRPEFEIALTVLTSVVSRTNGERVVVDSGVKALSCERGLPRPKDQDGLTTDRLNAEHGVLKIKHGASVPEPGEKIEMWVHYSDATINLHQRMYGLRDGVVEEALPICH